MKRRILLITAILAVSMSAGAASAAEQTTAVLVSNDASKQKESGQDFSFADVSDCEFYFSSGVGAWYTVLYIHEDGSFDGHYQDADMGTAEEAYPYGTLYYSDFSGSFTQPVMVNDTTWTFQIDSIEYPLGFGEEIKDGYYYDYSVAYGLDGAEDLYLYLPGSKLADLPEAYRSWVGYYDLDSVSETVLPFYGLYNEAQECGFSGYTSTASDAAGQIAALVAEAEAKAAELDITFQNAQSQAELNEVSGEIYTAWDDALNAIWRILKENLDETSMSALTQEELIWIDEKEAAAAEAGAEYEGGSMYSMIVNMKAAELTKERVYVLAEYLQ